MTFGLSSRGQSSVMPKQKINKNIRGLLAASWASTEMTHIVKTQQVMGIDLLMIVVTE